MCDLDNPDHREQALQYFFSLTDNEQDSDEEPDEGANEELATLEFLDSSNTSNSASTSRENTPNPPGL
nr:unnamed protein product [Callosobruchus chinensis]